jgi:hypothetical protein
MRRLVVVVSLLGAGAPAAADPNDLVLSRLTTRMTDANGNVTSVVGQNLEFRALASQLGVVLAPHLLTPADTTGFGGFELAVDYSMTSIDASAAYWRVLRSSPDPMATGATTAHGSDVMRTVGLFARKGMWFPVPSFEVGAGGIHLVDSHVWTGQLYAKFALHEGYHQLPLPSLAVRGAVSRMMTQRELDLTVSSLDITASKHFGIGGTWRLNPYAGWNLLMIIPRSEVIDATPNVDPLVPENAADITNNLVFAEQDTIFRNRFFAGAKFQYYVFQFTIEAHIALAGSSVDDRSGTSEACVPNATTSNCDAADTAAAQRTLSISAGFSF